MTAILDRLVPSFRTAPANAAADVHLEALRARLLRRHGGLAAIAGRSAAGVDLVERWSVRGASGRAPFLAARRRFITDVAHRRALMPQQRALEGQIRALGARLSGTSWCRP